MRKIMVFVIFINTMIPVFSEEKIRNSFDINWNIGQIGWETNISNNKTLNKWTVAFFNIFLENTETNLGFEFTLIKYWNIYNQELSFNERLNFVNINVFWSPLGIENIILGPFTAINYLNLNNWSTFEYNNLIFSTGIRFLWYLNSENFGYRFQIIESEIGYKNIYGVNYFYFAIKIDLTAYLYGLSSDTRKRNEEYEKQIRGSGGYVPENPK